MSALHLTARRQTGRTHVCTGITESVASSISTFLSLSLALFLSFFPIITQHTESFHVFLHVILSSPFLQSLLLLFFIIYNNYMDLPYNLYVCFFFHSFLFCFIYLSSKKRIKKDFVVAASKCNEMLSLPSMHKFVFRFKLTFFLLLYWTLPILYRTELSSVKVQITQYRYAGTAHFEATELLVQISVL